MRNHGEGGVIVRPIPAIADEFARAAEVLAIATRAWPVEPPKSVVQVDAVSNQLEGLRRSLIDMRCSLDPKK